MSPKTVVSWPESAKRQLNITTHRLHTLPILTLMPHSRCNCRCVMCDIWQANKNGTELTTADLTPHLATFDKWNVKWVVLSGGEALMHSNLWTLCQLLRQRHVKITLLSTGLLLKRHAQAVVRWCDEVIVSLDGSRDIHNAIRRIPRAYERLAEGVAALREQNPSFPITARTVMQQQNFADLLNIINAAHDLNLNQISFLPVDVASTAFNRPQPWGDERISAVALSPNETATFTQLVERVITEKTADFQSGFIAENPTKFRQLAQYFAALNGMADFPPIHCNAPWVSAVIEADGTVRPCFFHQAFGNIHEQPLDDILNAPKAITFRRQLDVTRDPICKKCVCTLSLGRRTPI